MEYVIHTTRVTPVSCGRGCWSCSALRTCHPGAAHLPCSCGTTQIRSRSTQTPSLAAGAACIMATKAFTVGGIGAQPSLDDVTRVASGFPIALDTAGADRIKRESPPPKAFAAEGDEAGAAAAADAGDQLPAEQARAVIIARLLSIMNGKSGVRLQVAEFLTQLLNLGIVPCLPASAACDAPVLAAVADACKGLGASTSGQALAAAAAAAGATPPGISAAERVVLQSGAAATAGVGALAVQGGRQALQAAAVVAALSCEAFGAQVKPFDAELLEAQGYKAATQVGCRRRLAGACLLGLAPSSAVLSPWRGAVAGLAAPRPTTASRSRGHACTQVGDDLRSLLEGSKAAGTRKGATPQEAAAFASLPQRLGAAVESLTVAYNALRPEVQSGALAPKVRRMAATERSMPTVPGGCHQDAHSVVTPATLVLWGHNSGRADGCGVLGAACTSTPIIAAPCCLPQLTPRPAHPLAGQRQPQHAQPPAGASTAGCRARAARRRHRQPGEGQAGSAARPGRRYCWACDRPRGGRRVRGPAAGASGGQQPAGGPRGLPQLLGSSRSLRRSGRRGGRQQPGGAGGSGSAAGPGGTHGRGCRRWRQRSGGAGAGRGWQAEKERQEGSSG